MSSHRESCLEMSLLFPAATLCKWLSYHAEKGGFDISLKQSRNLLSLSLVGKFDAVLLLESLRKVIEFSHEDSLQIALDELEGVDQLSLDALMVVLRACREKYHSVMMTGLQPWALQRLHATGVQSLLGRQWTGEFDNGSVCFRLNNQPKPTRASG